MKKSVLGIRVPGCWTGTHLLAGYPDVIRVLGYQPKLAVNTREYPGIFPPKFAGTRLRWGLVG